MKNVENTWTVEEANQKLKDKYGDAVFCLIEPYTEDDDSTWYRYWYHDGDETLDWNGFETVKEAYDDVCDYLSVLMLEA